MARNQGTEFYLLAGECSEQRKGASGGPLFQQIPVQVVLVRAAAAVVQHCISQLGAFCSAQQTLLHEGPVHRKTDHVEFPKSITFLLVSAVPIPIGTRRQHQIHAGFAMCNDFPQQRR